MLEKIWYGGVIIMKKIWIVAPFSSIATVGVRNRFQYLSNMLHNEKFDVILFTSDFSHGKKKHVLNDIVNKYPYRVSLIHEPGYKKNVSMKRVLSHKKFSMNLKRELKKMNRPDLIYAAYPTMSSVYLVGKYAKKNKIPFFIDVQDTWPESISSAINTDRLVVKMLMWPFTKFANKIYKLADVAFGVSETYAQRANVKGTKCKEFIPVYIGAELDKFDNVYIEEDEIEKRQGDIWVTYIGTLSHSYDIDTAVKAFATLKEYKNLKLLVLGSGPDEDRLINLAKDLGVFGLNIFYYGYIQYEQMVSILKKSDIALNALTAGSKGTITNKLGDYISAGLPILNSCQEKEVIDLVNSKVLGINYTPGDVNSLTNAVLNMVNDVEAMEMYSKNSRLLAEKYFDRKESYKIIVDKINEVLN